MPTSADKPLVIAHRGASAYLPEHTLEAKALAYGMGADYLEQDVVATRDDRLVVLHDVTLDTVTNVRQVYPDRARDDGHFYARDFDFEELQALNVHERRDESGTRAVFPGRFPTDYGRFRIPSLEEELALIKGMNQATGGSVGVYPEVKKPAWHHEEGVDVSALLLQTLARYGYNNADDPVFVQCFDASEVRRIRQELGCRMRLVQLIAENSWQESPTDYDHLKTAEGLREVSAIADGIGPWIGHIYAEDEIDGQPVSTGLVSVAKSLGLQVHPYTFRADQMAPGFDSFEAMLRWFVDTLHIDGVFTDFPDRARAVFDAGI